MAKTLYIDGCVKDYQFVSTEPIAIGLAVLERIPECETGFPAKVVDWAWKSLVNKNENAVFDESGVQMRLLATEEREKGE